MRVHHTGRSLAWVGFVGMLISLFDPMEGAFIALPFSAALTYAAFLMRSRYRAAIYWAFLSMTVGVAVLFTLSVIGGIGGSSGRSMWWALLLVPYPLGWVAGLFLGARVLREPSLSIREKIAG